MVSWLFYSLVTRELSSNDPIYGKSCQELGPKIKHPNGGLISEWGKFKATLFASFFNSFKILLLGCTNKIERILL